MLQSNNAIPSTFYEVEIGVEIFVELYALRFYLVQ